MWVMLTEECARQRTRLVLWTPVFLGVGVWLFFYQKFEPVPMIGIILSVCSVGLVAVAWRAPAALGFLLFGLAITSVGYAVSLARAHNVAAPVLSWNFYGSIEGTIIAIDRSGSDKPRLTLADPVLENVSRHRTPARVRLSLHSKLPQAVPQAGARILVTGHLSQPPGPVEPGGYDFQRRVWFQGLGALGYTRNPLMLLDAPQNQSWDIWVLEKRLAFSEHIRDAVGGNAGGFAAAILVGDRAHLNAADVEALRDANLAHLLAISGLHMGLMTGLVFTVLRIFFALIPRLALNYPVKKFAAVGAILAGLAYLVFSGGAVATQRAFIMISVMFLAVLVDRPAISLRAVAIAATLILLMRPEYLLEPGFQMSFAATTTLVVCFRALRGVDLGFRGRAWWQRAVASIFALLTSSLIAGLATAPFAAYHFNQVAHYGLVANALSLPIMGTVIMPAAVAAMIAEPLGIAAPFHAVMGEGIDWILGVAQTIASWGGAVSRVVDPALPVLPLLSIGAAMVILFLSRLRWLGAVPVIAAFGLWALAERPEFLLSADGRLVGIQGGETRWLNREKGNGFTARSWFENDGYDAAAMSRKWQDGLKSDLFSVDIGAQNIGYAWSKKLTADGLAELCAKNAIVIAPNWRDAVPEKCRLIDYADLRRDGALSITSENDVLDIKTARQMAGTRLWNSKDVRERLVSTD